MLRREQYVDVEQTSRYSSGSHLIDVDSSHPSTSAYTGGTPANGDGGVMRDDDGVGQHSQQLPPQQPSVADIDYYEYYPHPASVRRSCDVRRRHESSDETTFWNTDRSSVYYNNNVLLPTLWPNSRSTASLCIAGEGVRGFNSQLICLPLADYCHR